MADNSTRLDAGSSTETIASDDIGGIKHQRMKLEVGADGVAVDVQPPDADAIASSRNLPAGGLVWNEASWDRARGNTVGVALPSAARTVQTDSAIITNYSARGLRIIVSVTAGTGFSLTPQLFLFHDIPSGLAENAWTAAAAITASGPFNAYEFYPGSSGTVGGSLNTKERTSTCISRHFMIRMQVGNANSATYSVAYSLIV